MTLTPKLKACPFCGPAGETYLDRDPSYAWVGCYTCGSCHYADSADDAAAFWNTRTDPSAELLEVLDRVMIGGNHLANVLICHLGGGFASEYPPNMDHETALRKLCATDSYDVWCCWAAIMNARAAITKAGSRPEGEMK